MALLDLLLLWLLSLLWWIHFKQSASSNWFFLHTVLDIFLGRRGFGQFHQWLLAVCHLMLAFLFRRYACTAVSQHRWFDFTNKHWIKRTMPNVEVPTGGCYAWRQNDRVPELGNTSSCLPAVAVNVKEYIDLSNNTKTSEICLTYFAAVALFLIASWLWHRSLYCRIHPASKCLNTAAEH